jgi:hypothetical protein
MSQESKLTREELEKIVTLRDSIRTNVEKIGKMNIQRYFLQKELDFVNEQLSLLYDESMALSEQEKASIQEVVGKYGEGQLDFTTGVYSKV